MINADAVTGSLVGREQEPVGDQDAASEEPPRSLYGICGLCSRLGLCLVFIARLSG